MNQEAWTVIVVLIMFCGILALMARGWRGRKQAQAGLFDTLAQMPDDPGEVVLGPLSGVYIGSTIAGDWQARIARPPLGHRSAGYLTAHTGGLRLDLADATVWIPKSDLLAVRRGSALANKTVPGGGLIIARWTVSGRDGPTEIDSGFRADDKDSYPRWEALAGDATPADTPDAPDSTTEEKQ